MNIYFYLCLLNLLIIIICQTSDYYFLDLKSKNSSICDLRITTDKFIIFEKCELSPEWKLYLEKTTSQNSLEVYEDKETPIRVINIEYLIDNHKSQPDIKFTNIEIKEYLYKIFINKINITNEFPMNLKRGDNFDIIIEYGNMNYTYINLVIDIFMKNDLDSSLIELKLSYSNILFKKKKKKIDLSYLFLVLFFIICIFLLRLKFLIEENQFIVIHIDEIMQGKNAEIIFVVVGILLTILLFFIIIKYIFYITFVFSILLALISVKSFYKYLFKVVLPSKVQSLDDKVIRIKNYNLEYSNIVFYPLSILTIVFWYNISDETFDLHTYLNDIIFFTIVYFNVHKLNLKNFFIITGISFGFIIYQVIKIAVDDDKIQKDKNNVYYITTRFIIDVPIRFILKDFLESPFEEIYFFSILDISLIGYIVHYCDFTYHLSEVYFRISIYGTILGLIINIFLFYGLKFAPPMSLIPLFICIVSLIVYSIHKKQFFDFMDLDKEEAQDSQEMDIQEMEDPSKKNVNFNLSFRNSQAFPGETDNLKIKEQNEENGDDSEDEAKYENSINELHRNANLNIYAFSNKLIGEQGLFDDIKNENIKQSSMGIINEENNINNLYLSPNKERINSSLPNLRKQEIKNIEMKEINEKKDN